MTRAVYKRAPVRRDLVQHFVYLAKNAGPETADRFLANAERCFYELAEHPEMSSPLTLKRPELAGMRKWRVPDLENFLIFLSTTPARDLDGACAVCSSRLVQFAWYGVHQPRRGGQGEYWRASRLSAMLASST